MIDELEGRYILQEEITFPQSFDFPNSAAANSQLSLIYAKPIKPLYEYQIAFYNPSTITDLTVKVFALEDFEGSIRIIDSFITTFAVPKAQAITGTTIYSYLEHIHGMFNGVGMKVVISNDTVLTAAQGFTGYAKIKAMY